MLSPGEYLLLDQVIGKQFNRKDGEVPELIIMSATHC